MVKIFNINLILSFDDIYLGTLHGDALSCDKNEKYGVPTRNLFWRSNTRMRKDENLSPFIPL